MEFGSAPEQTVAHLENPVISAYVRHSGGSVGEHDSTTEDTVLSDMTAAGLMEPPTSPAASKAGAGKPESSTLHSLILKSLEDDGATDVVTINLKGKSSEADVMVVASGRSTRHVAAIADKLFDRVKHEGGVQPKSEGLETADWVLIDAGDVIVHVFRPEVREFYQLEKMWTTAPDAMARPASAG